MVVEELIERRPDIRFLSALTGEQGIKMARQSLPDVILMDINLGGVGIGGLETLKILSQDPLTAHIPVIALSSSAAPCNIKEGLEAGFFEYVTKPFKLSELMENLDRAFRYAKKHNSV
jgi:CheY-like chemotaxis protein